MTGHCPWCGDAFELRGVRLQFRICDGCFVTSSRKWVTSSPQVTQNTLFGGILQLVGVQNFKFSGYMTVSGLCMHDFGKFWKILENFLLFTEIPTEKMLQRQIYVQNIQYDVLLRKEGGS